MTPAAILHARFERPSFETYRELFTVLGDITPVVQALPPDSALLDLTGALRYWQRTPAQLADLVQTRIMARYGLTTAIGGGPTRMLATIAADLTPPGAVRILDDDPAAALAFLQQQPVRALPGIGPAMERTLHRYGLATVGDLADLPPATLQRIAGASTARLLRDRAHGIDPRRVTPAGPPPGITARRRFDHDILDPAEARRTLLDLAVDLGARLRHSRRCASRIELQITLADRTSLIRSRTLTEATSHSPRLQDTLYQLFSGLGLQRARMRTFTARAAGLTDTVTTAVQLTLDRATEDARRLEPVIDRANSRFGSNTLQPAALAARTHRQRPRADLRR
ncbi:DNA polymerase Y family protein [Streptomyces sp. RKAG337]|uniref:DNA polymerase Y family protein n=1 Tax=Streptomyces sp. RKAG337 TaxID=2893404 RepID=UPI0020344F33|nr:hypothetical protein [Streptomyces sp. RKAG337]MCM2431074.1 hypothetical protein [Streptomyces sp. RKAG337]